jgi:DNA-binding response OmpR family regulator
VKPTTTRDRDECVLLIGDEASEAARLLGVVGSSADEPVRIEWLRELSSGIERLRSGAVGAVVLDLTFPDSGGMETLDNCFQAALRVPILVLCGAHAENGKGSSAARDPRLSIQESVRRLPVEARSAYHAG